MTMTTIPRLLLSFLTLLVATITSTSNGGVSAFLPTTPFVRSVSASSLFVLKAAESDVSFGELDGKDVRIGIVHSRWNDEHVSNLVDGCRKALKDCGVVDSNTFTTSVPGSFELPLAAKLLALSGTVDAIVTIGVLIKGETMHFEYISETVSSGIMSVSLQTSTPIVFGVLTCLDEEQVKKRSTEPSNHGYDWGKTAVEMALLRKEALGSAKRKGGKTLEAIGFQSEKGGASGEGEKERVGFF